MKSKRQNNTILRSVIVLILCILCTIGVFAAPKYVVVIDAGHGGKDYGAIDNDTREKDINLAVALEVGNYIKKHAKNVKVVYTRDKDVYLTLQQRADKANEAKGDLFISIHTNSLDKSNTKRTTVAGASTYTLGLHKDNDNMNVARRENSVMTLEPNYETTYSGFDPRSDESYIIFEMAQKGNLANSVKFAEQVQNQLSKVADRKDRGVHQAGFWVLWATSMPAVLVELDFICNPTSAKFMSSSQGQDKLGTAIGSAAVAYFKALEQHDKNRLRTDENEPAESVSPDYQEGAGVVLASVTEEEVKGEAPQEMVAERTRKPASRRRRSDASREKSERQQYAEAIIKEEKAYIDKSATIASASSEAQQTAQASSNTNKAQSKTSDKKTSNKKSKAQPVQLASTKPAKTEQSSSKPTTKPVKNEAKPAKTMTAAKTSTPTKATAAAAKPTTKETKASAKPSMQQASIAANDQSPAKMAKVTTVYKIQILSSSEKMKSGNPLFHGLNPISCIPQGNNYLYVYGESTNRNEMYQLLEDIKSDFPDAKVIRMKKTI